MGAGAGVGLVCTAILVVEMRACGIVVESGGEREEEGRIDATKFGTEVLDDVEEGTDDDEVTVEETTLVVRLFALELGVPCSVGTLTVSVSEAVLVGRVSPALDGLTDK